MNQHTKCKRIIFTASLVNEYGRDLPDIMSQTLSYNAATGTHTMMLSSHGNLIQAIEGDPVHVNEAWRRVSNDARYFNQTKLEETWVSEPSFEGTHAGMHNYVLLSDVEFPHPVKSLPMVADELNRRIRASAIRQRLTQFAMDFA
ncbi:MAG: hypothetical protein CFE44_01735 [Burkholderiales bacterium PBB4]|nr:MAG: hypothetical protein CFE44_01735 [Burkholderiales bacterium PBB4]